MKCWCQHLFPHIAAIVELVQGRVEAAVWDYPACTPKPTFTMKALMIWSGHADGKMLLSRLLRVLLPALFFHHLLPFPYCPPCGAVACVWHRAGFSVFIYPAINTALSCYGSHLAWDTALQDSCLQHITVQQPAPRRPFVLQPVTFSLTPSCAINFKKIKNK